MSKHPDEVGPREIAFARLDQLAPVVRQLGSSAALLARVTLDIKETLGDGATPILSDWGHALDAIRAAAYSLGLEDHLVEVPVPDGPLTFPLAENQ